MSAFSALCESIAGVIGESIALVLFAKWTGLLAVAWLAHGMLAGRNPRWRVALWRATSVGVVLVAVLSWAPPIVEYRVAPAGRATAEVARSPSIDPTAHDQAAAGALENQSIEALDSKRVSAHVARTGGSADAGLNSPRAQALPSVPEERQAARRAAGAAAWVVPIWLTGVLILTVWLIVGSLGLARLVRRSSEVPDAIDEECRELAVRLRCRPAVRVRLTSEVSTPCLAGLWRLVLLLPERECKDMRADELRAILAHELAHARNHDLTWNFAAHLSSIVLWFHPLAWRIRAAHATACDAVCDAVAVDVLGDVVSYGKVLARLALRAARPSPVHALAMARSSDVRRRIEALSRKVLATRLSWRRVAPAIVLASVVLLVIGGFGFTRESAPASHDDRLTVASTPQADDPVKHADQISPGKLKIRAALGENGQPIEGVSIEYRGSFDGKDQKGTVTTGKDGMATIEYPASAHVGYFDLTARKPNLVPMRLSWNHRLQPVDLPATQELRFEPGTTIGGIVNDAAGHPIPGAAVKIFAPRTQHEGAVGRISFGELKTDALGRWRLDVAPRELRGVWVTVIHPRYRINGGPASRNLDGVIVLTKGLSVTGLVVDVTGRPVKGALVSFGYNRFAPNAPMETTNERGEFTVENCERGHSIATVQADGFAPQIAEVRIEEHTRPVEIQLTEPGSVLRGRVVDVEGNAVSGAFLAADTWRGHRSLHFRVNTDNDGRFEWKSAPKDVVLYDAGKLGYMSSRHVALTADDRDHIITLLPELVITGRVTDAHTARPLPEFRLIRGQMGAEPGQTYWAENEAIEIAGSRFTTRFDEPSEPFFVRVEAPGYQPAVSRPFLSTGGNQTFDFALQRGQNQLSGIVVLPDGKPATGAEVLVDTRELGWLMQAGHFDPRVNAPRLTARRDGRFTFTPPADPFYLVAISDFGYAHAWADEFARSGKLVLQPWGKIEGELRIRRKPAPLMQVEFYPAPVQRGGRFYALTYGYTTITDKLGRFAFDRVMPVRGTVSRVVVNAAASAGFPASGWQETVEVKPGQTARVQLGGKGRPVLGRIVVHGTPETPVDWTKNQPVVIQIPLNELKDSLGYRSFGSHIDRDGRFRVEDVPPGNYELEVTVNSDSYPQDRGAESVIGSVKRAVIVPGAPDARTDEPLDLGTITVELFETLKPGDMAPDFTVARIAGKGRGDQLRLDDYRGKLILLDFWATWCGPCVAEMPAIKDIQKTFGNDERFRMISLSLDETAEVAQRYVKENGLIWTHGFAGNLLAGVSAGKVYKVRSIPATFLIGPDGRILAKNLRGGELKAAVRKALEDRKLFPTADGKAKQP